ncbi:MAG: class I SAM-dependent methyltransferase [Anaerolineae bacterium]|jgi:SAM-dependent methyltransferase|nr:class I SAM-dependent methyltransferase [Anaerolineae bacterium]
MTLFDESELYSGLASQMWAAYTNLGDDYPYFKQVLTDHPGLVLDIGCGTGRLLRAFLRDGFTVEGVDIAADQLEQCRRLAEEEGLPVPVLYAQPMQALDLPKRYDAIIIPCGSLACVMDRRAALDALRRLKHHLAPGGVLVFNLFIEEEAYPRKTYPEPWRDWSKAVLPDGKTLFTDRRVVSVDRLEQAVVEERRYRVIDGDSRDLPALQDETRTGGYRWYTRNEALWMIELAGLTVDKITGDYTDEPFGPHHTNLMMFHTH